MNSKKKRILFVCNYFAPDNAVAAIRITKMVKYLTMSGYEIVVLAEKKDDNQEDEILKKEISEISVYRVQNSKKAKCIIKFYNRLIKKAKEKRYGNLENRVRVNKKSGKEEFYPFQTAYPIIGSLDYLIELLRQHDLSVQARNKLKEFYQFDICISSYGDYFGLITGIYLKKKTGIKWIFDMRDPVCSYKFTPPFVWKIAERLEKKASVNADVVTAVTATMCQRLRSKYNANVFCVTNGYDLSDRELQKEKQETSDKMRLTYTGAMYGGLQDLSVLFECIKELAKEELVNLNKIEFHFAGRQSAYEIFNSQASKYHLEGICVNHGRLPRREALNLQDTSHLLVASIWDFAIEPVGIISGKILEYMSARRPIIAIINSDMKDNEVSKIVEKCNLGIVYEKANPEEGKHNLKKYIEDKYLELSQTGKISFSPCDAELEKYDYKNIMIQMESIVATLDNNPQN